MMLQAKKNVYMMNKLNEKWKNWIFDQSHLLCSFLLFTLTSNLICSDLHVLLCCMCVFFLNTFTDAVFTSASFSKSTPCLEKKNHTYPLLRLFLCVSLQFPLISTPPPPSPFHFLCCTRRPHRFSTLSPPVIRLIPRPLMCLFSLFYLVLLLTFSLLTFLSALL